MQDNTRNRQVHRQGVYVLCCVALSLFGCLTGPDGELGQLEEEIVNPDPSGNVTTPTDAVIIRRPVVSGSPAGTLGGGFCTGTRIGDGRVLTAGHCLDPDLDRVGLRFGAADLSAVHSFVQLDTNKYAMSGMVGKSNVVVLGDLFGASSTPSTMVKNFGQTNKINALITNNGILYGTGSTKDSSGKRAALFRFTETGTNINVSIVPLDVPGTSGSALAHYYRGDGIASFAVAIKSTKSGVEYGKSH